ncbi:MAG: ParB N-terminal domain-containing protein [Thermoplasmata archaeon]
MARSEAEGVWMRYRFEILDVEVLHSHEGIDPEMLECLVERIAKDGALFKPIVVDDRNNVILDGHHRFEALKRLGCRRIPAYLVDYMDDAVEVVTWPGAVVNEISKADIIEMGLSDNVYPPKTSRHIIKVALEDRTVDLAELR